MTPPERFPARQDGPAASAGRRAPEGHEVRGASHRGLLRFESRRKEALEIGRTRVLVAGIVFAFVFAVIGVRIMELALLHGGSTAVMAAVETQDRAPRAEIVDRNGVLLATTLPSASLYADTRQVRDPQEAAARLARALPSLSEGETAARLASGRSFVWLKRGLTPREQDAVNRLGIPGIYFETEQRRFYPQGDLAAHIVGFVDIDNNGLAGLERSFDDLLRDGGRPLELSVDMRVQHILTEEISAAMEEFRAIGAAGLILDANSGEVLAMASLPSFDPNRAGSAQPEQRFNRVTLGTYEMGSVFKLLTAAMVLETDTVDITDTFDVTDPIRVSRFSITDYRPRRGHLSVAEIMQHSSNIGTVKMALEAGTAVQQRFLGELGLLQPLSFELPETGAPLVPSPWREVNTMTISYGHGLAVTPLQIANAVATTVNGGVRRNPTLLRRSSAAIEAADDQGGQRVFSEDTSNTLRWLMRLVVQDGTGRSADVPGYLIGGKTGTANKQMGGGYSRDARIASFVGAFPMDDPRYVIFIMVDEPKGHAGTYGYATGGWVAAPVVRRVVSRMGPLLGLAPREHEVAPPLDLEPLREAMNDDVQLAAQ